MAISTRNMLEKIAAAEEKTHQDTMLDLSKAEQFQEEDGAFQSPKTPANSPRTIERRIDLEGQPLGIVSPRSSSPRFGATPLKKSPRYLDLTELSGRASPPREEGRADIEKATRTLPESNDSIIVRKKSSGSFSGHFKVTKRNSRDSIGAAQKPDEAKAVDDAPKTSPLKQ